jgi:hypothetical protein
VHTQKNKSVPVESAGAHTYECPQCDHVMIMRDISVECERCCPTKCSLQSEEVLLAPTATEMATSTEVTTTFIDANAGASVGVSTSPLDYELADAQTSADLASFLARPVRLLSLPWAPSDPVGLLSANQNVWANFLNNASIKNKLSNYAFIRGNLKLKIVTNASPFLYGSLRLIYRPLHQFKGLTISSTLPSSLVPYSQMPGVWITPAHSEGAEFTCPFIWPKSFLRTLVISDATAMGAVDLMVFNPLASANGATSSVVVQVYAWMEDVVLAGPTVGAVLQADEYGVGAVSAPASAIAAAASKLSSVPTIGRFAKATEIGASAVSNIAKLFGYTNVPVIADTSPVRNNPFPSLASAEIGYPHDKLALDPKNELSIDPAIAGLGSEDELAVSHFVQRESFLVGTSWSSAQLPDTPLFTSLVVPTMTYAVSDVIDFTPPALVSTMFNNWRGDMIFRFKFIATAFHKGRVRISYDPQATSIQTTGDTGPFVLNKIIDLGAETDVEFRIPYQQALPWCYTLSDPASSVWTTSVTPTLSATETFHNGIITLKVLTSLTGPTTTASVGVQVFVRGAENLEFANPASRDPDLTPFAIQSEEYYDNGTPMADVMGTSTEASTHRALVNFGESVHSLRTLMRRHNFLDVIVLPAATANTNGVFRLRQTRYPAFYGFDPSGLNVAKGVNVPASNFNFNFVNVTPWHLISNCFLAQRGSMNWVFNPDRSSTPVTSRITRGNTVFPGYTAAYYSGPNTNVNIAACNFWKQSANTGAGASLTHTSTTNGHAIVAPSYSPFKFQSTFPGFTSSPATATQTGYDGTIYDWLSIEYPYNSALSSLANLNIERYFGIGADYTLHFFSNCPTLRYLAASSVVPV